MPPNERNRPEDGKENKGSDTSHIVDLYRSTSDRKKEDPGSAVSHGTLSVWAGILLLAGMLAFGFYQIKGWVEGVHEKLEQVSQDNKLLLEGLDELLVRADQLDRVAETESSTPGQTARKTSEEEQDPGNDLSRKYKIYYRTKEGEGLTQISQKFGVSVDQLRLWNTLEPADPLIPGQVLVINKSTKADKPSDVAGASPRPTLPRTDVKVAKSEQLAAEETDALEVGSDPQPQTEPVQEESTGEGTAAGETGSEETAGTSTPAETEEPPVERAEAAADEPIGEIPDEPVEEDIIHTVQAGETLSDIGQEYGVPWETLAAYNNIARPEALYEGQTIRIPMDDRVSSTTDAMPEITHTVQAGENLYRIGLKYGVNWEAIARENDITDSSVLFEGQVLKIPAARGGPEF
jgi:LysM repeat protein